MRLNDKLSTGGYMSLIRMWSTGELRREFFVHKAKQYMKITRPLEPNAIPVVIDINNAHVYYPQSTDEIFYYMPVYRGLAHEHLMLPDDMSTIRRFVDYIQDGFDELRDLPPIENDREKRCIGELTASFGDIKIAREVME